MPSAQDAGLFRLPEELPALYWLQHWQTAKKHWKTLAGFTAGGTALGLLIAASQTQLYHASTSIEVQGITDNFLKSQDGNPNAGADAELMDLQTQIRIMQSGSVVDGVMKKLSGRPSAGNHAALTQARDSLNVHVAGPTRIVEIAADSSQSRVAADFVNALADAYIDQHVEARWQGTERGAAKLRAALEDMRVKLEKSEGALQDYARNSRLLLSGDRGVVSEDKLRLLQTELAHAQADRAVKQSRFDAVAAATEAALPAVVNSPAAQDAESKLTDLRRQLAELGTTYTADYSKVKRLRAQIDPLETAIRKDLAGARLRARSEFDEARQREQLLESANRSEVEAIAIDAQKKVHYDALRREVDSTRALYDTMLARVKEAAIGSAMRASNVRVLDSAQPAAEPFQPRRLRMGLLGGIAGLFLGVGFAGARQQTDRSIWSAGELEQLLGVREFGSIASMRASLLLEEKPLAENAGASAALVITSANAGEGKTTVAVNLAVALAEIGKRVLLIDGDLRFPRLHTIFNTPLETGLIDLLAIPVPLLDLQVAQALRATAHAHLELLSAGVTSAGSSDFLYSSRLPEVMAYGRKFFDIVLIDSPPMVQIPDARILGRAASAVVVVARTGKTARESVLAVRQRLLEDRPPITGCVLNEWNAGPFSGTPGKTPLARPLRERPIPGSPSLSSGRSA